MDGSGAERMRLRLRRRLTERTKSRERDAPDIADVLRRFSDAVAEQAYDEWLSLFAPGAVVEVDVVEGEPPVACTTPAELWGMLFAAGWEAVYWVQTAVELELWASVLRTVTNVDDHGGTIWTGVDSFVFDDDGRITRLHLHDHKVEGMIG